MFDQEEWRKLIPVASEFEEPYNFAYFLGNNPEHRKAVKRAAKELNYKVVALRHLDQYVAEDEDFGDIAPYDVGPDRFLNLLREASFVCTDSFHGSCFSIIHRKPFVTFNRYGESAKYSKNSRIDTLCDNLGLQDRRYKGIDKLAHQLSFAIDYNAVQERLSELKSDAEAYLDAALKT